MKVTFSKKIFEKYTIPVFIKIYSMAIGFLHADGKTASQRDRQT
jgi:general stress protein CsbA